jgi:hypothetical protein
MADKIATDFISKIKAKSGQAIDWFKDIVKKTQQAAFPAATGRRDIMTDRNIGVSTGKPNIGQLYLFQYSAKWKDILPYWDMWPLIFPFDYAKDGFYGINLHYLPPNARTALMIRLIKAQGGGGNMNENFKLKLNYSIITSFKPAIPCIKRYLFSQVQGKGLYGIGGEDWSYAAALPLHKFQKESAKYVWTQSALKY